MRFVLTLQPFSGVDPIRALRWVLKGLLRQHGMRCAMLREGSIRLDVRSAISGAGEGHFSARTFF